MLLAAEDISQSLSNEETFHVNTDAWVLLDQNGIDSSI